MRFSVITPSFNGGRFLEASIKSVLQQRTSGIELEYIIIDGDSSDRSHEIFKKYKNQIDHLVIEKDAGPANAINKGFSLATGEIVSWLNTDDVYFPGTLDRVQRSLSSVPEASFCFGACIIIDENDNEIRKSITRFKELFYPFSSRFTHQCINYLSQPALFFYHNALEKVGWLREDMVAAWDYEFFLRLWRSGHAIRVKGKPLSAFRWYESSISGQNFYLQFKEEYEAAKKDAGIYSLQNAIHLMVRFGITGAYFAMAWHRHFTKDSKKCELA